MLNNPSAKSQHPIPKAAGMPSVHTGLLALVIIGLFTNERVSFLGPVHPPPGNHTLCRCIAANALPRTHIEDNPTEPFRPRKPAPLIRPNPQLQHNKLSHRCPGCAEP